MTKKNQQDFTIISIEGSLVEKSVDTSPMALSRYIQQDQRKLYLTRPLMFTPYLDEETKQFYIIRDESMNIDVDAPTRESLMQNLEDQLFFLWDTYGNNQVDPDLLTWSALNLRQVLRQHFQETCNQFLQFLSYKVNWRCL